MNEDKDIKMAVPKLRFPEFVSKNKWTENNIGGVSTSYSGGTPSTVHKAYYGGKIPFIRSAEINKLSTELFIK